jgi:hypothetical protein
MLQTSRSLADRHGSGPIDGAVPNETTNGRKLRVAQILCLLSVQRPQLLHGLVTGYYNGVHGDLQCPHLPFGSYLVSYARPRSHNHTFLHSSRTLILPVFMGR